jgi:hypothetical protein
MEPYFCRGNGKHRVTSWNRVDNAKAKYRAAGDGNSESLGPVGADEMRRVDDDGDNIQAQCRATHLRRKMTHEILRQTGALPWPTLAVANHH